MIDLLTGAARVLVVDDYYDAADSQAMLLQLWGYHVRAVYSGAAAIEVARTYRPTVVLCDLSMPGMNGYEVARRLRQQLGLKNTLLVALTAYDEPEDYEHSRAAGFDYHLVKPVDPCQLEQLLHLRREPGKAEQMPW